MLGVGAGPSAESLERLIDEAIAERGIALGKRPIEVRVAVLSAPAADRPLEDLIHRAAQLLPSAPTRQAAD